MKVILLSRCWLEFIIHLLIEIIVGFEKTFTSVDEEDGSVELCVLVFNESFILPPDTDFNLILVSVPNTAGMYEVMYGISDNFYSSLLDSTTDFKEINYSKSPLDRFTSDSSTHKQCFNVTIINDEIPEDIEHFTLSLILAGADPTYAVVVTPNVSVVEIYDNDCKFHLL